MSDLNTTIDDIDFVLNTASVCRRATHILDATMFWNASGGGVRRYLLLKRAWLRRHAGWRHTIVAPGADRWGMVDCGGLPLPMSGGYRLPIGRDHAASIIESRDPDIIEAGDPYRLAWSCLDAARRLDIPTVAFCHSNIAAMAARLAGGQGVVAKVAYRTAATYLQRVYRAFDVVIAPSQAMASELQEWGIRHVELQALGVDTTVFHSGRRDPTWRVALGLPPNARLLLYAGRFAPEKNLPLLVKAIERLGEPYYLLAVGQGPMPPQGARVLTLPYMEREEDLARVYASADGFVHAGDQETFGLSALEAMACGTPLAVRAAAGLCELVDGGAGIAVDSSQPEAWAEAIAELFGPGRDAWIRQARARAEALDWRRVMPEILARYRRLAASRRSSTRRPFHARDFAAHSR